MFNEATVLHHRYVMRQPRHDAHVMRHQQQSQTAPGDNIRQQVEDARLGDGIEIGRRLVGDDSGARLSRARATIIRCSMPPLISKG